MRRIYKLLKFSVLLGLYIGVNGTASLVILNETRRRRALVRLTSFFSGIFLETLGIDLQVEHKGLCLPPARNVLVVSNHLSYLDIAIISSRMSAVFITSVEMRNTFLIGLLCRLGGSYFVERRNIFSITAELIDLEEILSQGFSLTLFPEGTSSDGEKILPIKNTLLVTSMRASIPIQPICLNYVEVDGFPVSRSNKDILFWYGDMEFFPHLWRLLSIRKARVKLSYLEPMFPEKHASRKKISGALYDQLNQAFSPVI